jgi:aminopeptidase N
MSRRHRVIIAVVVAVLVGTIGVLALTGGDDHPQGRQASADEAGKHSRRPSGPPHPGASGVGDPLYPDLGNGGFDVRHYDLALTWKPDGGGLTGVATIEAKATQALSRFDLDLLAGLEVSDAKVDGQPATTERQGDHELVVTPAHAIGDGATFETRIAYGGAARSTDALLPGLGGWVVDGREVYVASEPDGAAGLFPGNDHPSDKATYSLDITAPDDLVVVANGDRVPTRDHALPGGMKTWHFEMKDPMASYLLQVGIGNLRIVEGKSPKGVPIRNAFDEDVLGAVTQHAKTGQMIDYYASLFGPYPFSTYGVLVVDDPIGFALETQTLSLFPGQTDEETVAHELAHQWFGDDVSLGSWKDIWLNEGFATYSSWLWLDHTGAQDIDARVRREARNTRELALPPADPGTPEHLFDASVYYRGAITLHVLRHAMGDDRFFELLRTWAERYGGKSATTADFEALAEDIAGKDLTPLFDAWLRSDRLPRLSTWLE